MLVKLSTKQIAAILGVSTGRVMVIKSNEELYKRLEDIGFKVIGECKEGRSVYYNVEFIENKDRNSDIKIFNKNVFGVNNEKFIDYYLRRTRASKGKEAGLNDLITKENLAKDVGVSRQTICVWDSKLVKMGILREDDPIYLHVQCVPEKNIFKSSIYDYKQYHKNVINTKNIYYSLLVNYRKGLIDDSTIEFACNEYQSAMKELADNYVVRIKTYKLNEENPTHKEAIRLYTE